MGSVEPAIQYGGIIRSALPWWLVQNKPEGKVLLVLPDDDEVMDFVGDASALF